MIIFLLIYERSGGQRLKEIIFKNYIKKSRVWEVFHLILVKLVLLKENEKKLLAHPVCAYVVLIRICHMGEGCNK